MAVFSTPTVAAESSSPVRLWAPTTPSSKTRLTTSRRSARSASAGAHCANQTPVPANPAAATASPTMPTTSTDPNSPSSATPSRQNSSAVATAAAQAIAIEHHSIHLGVAPLTALSLTLTSRFAGSPTLPPSLPLHLPPKVAAGL